jgi:shikimate dehydrogenase
MDEYSILINCTPVGMWPDSDKCPDIPYAYISDKHLLYDVIYRPEETLFMKKGAQNGAIVKNGYQMWQRQADATWRIWNE